MAVPFSKPDIGDREVEEVSKVLKSGWLSRGPKCKEFEEAFAQYVGAKHAVSLNSGTSALHLSLLAHGIGPGDKVIVPTMTFPATVNAVLYVGATPVLIDCGRDYNYSIPSYLQNRDLEGAKAVIGVDMHGLPCTSPITPSGAIFIRDAAHSLGANTQLGKVGGIEGETTCFSFYATKNITTGDGGMLTTDDDEVAEKVRRLSLHGMDKDAWRRYEPGQKVGWDIPEIGFKYNMTDIQAAIGLVQLEKLDTMLQNRLNLAAYYHLRLTSLAAEGKVVLPPWKSCWHVYAVRVEKRDEVAEKLKDRGIGVGIHFRPIHDLPYMKPYVSKMGGEYSFPVAGELGRQTLSLPFYTSMTNQEVNEVIHALEEVLE